MFYGIVLGLHVIVCILLILVVLLQSAKGGGLAGGSAFGGGAESTMFGARGAATVLSKATTLFGALFMVTSLSLTLLGAGRSSEPSSVVVEEAQQQGPIGAPPTQTAPPVPPAGFPEAEPGAVPALPDAGGETSPDGGDADSPDESGGE